MRSDCDVVCLNRVTGSSPIQAHTLNVGARRPLGLGAGGLAILMALPGAEAEAVIATNGQRHLAWERLSAQRLRELVALSRRTGYVINDEDLMPGVGAIGIAFETRHASSASGMPALAAISIAAIATRMRGNRRKEPARELAAELKLLTRRINRG